MMPTDIITITTIITIDKSKIPNASAFGIFGGELGIRTLGSFRNH